MNPGRLVVVTGPSHAGKTTTIELARRSLEAPTAAIAIDDIIGRLDLGDGDLWADGLPVAYDVAVASAGVLLKWGFVVFVESTFTFIPCDGREGRVHRNQLDRLVELAETVGARPVVVRLSAGLDAIEQRRAVTGRLDHAVVEGIWLLHQAWSLGAAALQLDTSGRQPEDIAAVVLAEVGRIEARPS